MPKASSRTTQATSKLQSPWLSQRPHKNRKRRTAEERYQDLCNDPWIVTKSINDYEVCCYGCNKTISLERTPGKSGPFYDTLWKKHRDLWCHGVRKWREEQERIARQSTDTSDPESETSTGSSGVGVNVPQFQSRVDMLIFLMKLDMENPAAFESLTVHAKVAKS
ncbi:hypothetical protein Moror_8159 [Moniliophthora roreri MCA 2997]|uniref:Uncharacterized protein n=2 Tax=Moniliophthora roreri TaxID=221103 RepID=V2XKV6_MONRO|nr:hypothetical protein Moror_8159 [Moniliophthora roreri MCA 2997]